jgi:hypothetical protein
MQGRDQPQHRAARIGLQRLTCRGGGAVGGEGLGEGRRNLVLLLGGAGLVGGLPLRMPARDEIAAGAEYTQGQLVVRDDAHKGRPLN